MEHLYGRDIRAGATRDQAAQADALLNSAKRLIDSEDARADLNLASNQINEVNRLCWIHGWDQDAFCTRQFSFERANRHLAQNPAAFDHAVAKGEKALAAEDIAALRGVLRDILLDQISRNEHIGAEERASLMRV